MANRVCALMFQTLGELAARTALLGALAQPCTKTHTPEKDSVIWLVDLHICTEAYKRAGHIDKRCCVQRCVGLWGEKALQTLMQKQQNFSDCM